MNGHRSMIILTALAVAAPLMSCGSSSPTGVPSAASPTVGAPVTGPATAAPVPAHTLLVTGTGEVAAPPDQVTVNLGVDAQAASAPLALNQANADMSRLVASLRHQGIQPADTSTTELSLYRGYNAPYNASQSVDVIIHHIANAGPVISAAMNAVGNDATVSGVSYSIRDPSSQEAAARQKAMAAAHVEAVQMALLAGQSLGAVISVSDELVTAGSTGGCNNGCGGAGGSVPLSPGVDQVSITLYVTYAIG